MSINCKICGIIFQKKFNETCCGEVCKKESRRISFITYNERHKERRAKARKLKYIPHPKIKKTKKEKLEARRLTYDKYRERKKIYANKWTLNNKSKVKNKHLISKYGITLEEFEAKKQKQDNKCDICKSLESSTTTSGAIKQLAVDHCHVTGKIRDLLCTSCNTALGKTKDSINLLESMIQYLRKHKEQHENTVD